MLDSVGVHPDPMAYIRRHYNVPAFVGGRIRFHGLACGVADGRIAGATGQYLIVDLDPEHPAIAGLPGRYLLHPTWKVEYLDVPGEYPDVHQPKSLI